MAEPFLSEIRLMSFGFPPKGWAQCNGQLLPINQNQALFSLLGTTFGGDGRVNFGLPDLRSRVPVCWQGNFQLGERGGEENHTLNTSEMTSHTHALMADVNNGNTDTPASNTVLGKGTLTGVANPGTPFTVSIFSNTAPGATLAPASVGNAGGSQAHTNIMPY